VDDDPRIASNLEVTFRAAGFATCAAYRGDEARWMMKTKKPRLKPAGFGPLPDVESVLGGLFQVLAAESFPDEAKP
jgi:hypothetical protein